MTALVIAAVIAWLFGGIIGSLLFVSSQDVRGAAGDFMALAGVLLVLSSMAGAATIITLIVLAVL